MMLMDNGLDGPGEFSRPLGQYVITYLGVGLDQLELNVGELAGFGEDLTGDRYLAQIVDGGGQT